MPTLERLLTVPQSARLTALTPGKFEQLIREKRTPEIVSVAGEVRIRASDLDRWLALGCPDRETFEAAKVASAGAE